MTKSDQVFGEEGTEYPGDLRQVHDGRLAKCAHARLVLMSVGDEELANAAPHQGLRRRISAASPRA